MEKDDARKLSPAEQHERRRQVIRAHKRGRTRAQIAAEVGLSHTAVTKVIARYEQEGAAGSSYYTAPVTITDGARRLSGEVVLRRANDVPGATPEQLRWHIESSTLEP